MNTYTPLISIVIPVYNGANYMRQAIDSALAQTYDHTEIIVVNDGSTDNGETERIALSYGDKITYYRKENGGCASALNYGIERMNGEWLSWLSHDDLYLPDKLQSQVDAINEIGLNKEHTILSCETGVIDETGAPVPHMPGTLTGTVKALDMTKHLLNDYSLNGCALLIPRAALQEIGPFRTDYTYILDMIYWTDLAVAGYDFYFSKGAYSLNRKHGEQVSVKKRALLAGERIRFAHELAERLTGDKDRALSAWVYCRTNNCTEGCQLLEAKHKIPVKLRLTATKILLRRKLKAIVKKILRIR